MERVTAGVSEHQPIKIPYIWLNKQHRVIRSSNWELDLVIPQFHFASPQQNQWIWQRQHLYLPNMLVRALESLRAGREEAGMGPGLSASPSLPSQGYGSVI